MRERPNRLKGILRILFFFGLTIVQAQVGKYFTRAQLAKIVSSRENVAGIDEVLSREVVTLSRLFYRIDTDPRDVNFLSYRLLVGDSRKAVAPPLGLRANRFAFARAIEPSRARVCAQRASGFARPCTGCFKVLSFQRTDNSSRSFLRFCSSIHLL